jgi:hypothetical protein
MGHGIGCHINVAGSVSRFLLNQLSCPRIKAACDRLTCIAGHQPRQNTADRLCGLLNKGQPNPLPQLTIKGRWLEALGFTTGQKIEVITGPGQLITRLATEG